MKPILTIAIGLSLAASNQAKAAVLALYNFDANNLQTTDGNLNSSANDIASGGGLNTTITNAPNKSSLSLNTSSGTYNDGTLIDSDYYTFTITPSAGYELDLTSISFYAEKNDTFGASSTVEIRSSVDSYGSTLASSTIPGGEPGDTFLFDVSSLANTTSAVTFRVYFDTGASFGANQLYLDDITLNGDTIVIPEPSTMLFGVASVALLLRRRRS